jgi:hypothetical protein
MAQERLDERLEKSSVVSAVTLRNLLMIAAGALLFFWPLSQRAFASIWACAGCSCVDEEIDYLASCTALAQCVPEARLLIVHAEIEYLCGMITPVKNQATTTGSIGGDLVFATEYARSMYWGRVCINQWQRQYCNGNQPTGITSEDVNCCYPYPGQAGC